MTNSPCQSWAPWGGPYSHRCGPSGFEVRRLKKGMDPTECFSHPKKSCDLKSLGESPEPCKNSVQWFLGQVFSLVVFLLASFLGVWDTGLWQNRRVFFQCRFKGNSFIYLAIASGKFDVKWKKWWPFFVNLHQDISVMIFVGEKNRSERLAMVAAGNVFWGGIIVLGSIGRCRVLHLNDW